MISSSNLRAAAAPLAIFVALVTTSPARAEPVTCEQDLRDIRLITFTSPGNASEAEVRRNVFTCGSEAKTNVDEGFGVVGEVPLTGVNAMAIGIKSEANGVSTMAIGLAARAQRIGGLAIGEFSFTGGPWTTAVGQYAQALGTKSAAFGGSATVRGDFGAAFGADAEANNGGSAFGAGTKALLERSVALGQGSIASRANSVSFGTVGGERQLTNVAAGTQATDAVNKAQLDVVEAKADAAQITANLALTAAASAGDGATVAQATAEAAIANAAAAQTTAETARTEAATAQGTANMAIVRSDTLGDTMAAALGGGATYDTATGAVSAPSYSVGGQSYNNAGSAFAAVDSSLSALDTRIDALGASTDRGFRRANGGIATALALGGTMIVPDSDVSVNFNLATYRGEQGFSGAVVVRAAPRVYVSGGFAGSTVKGSTGGRVGVAFGF